MRLAIQTMKLIFLINYCYLIDKLEIKPYHTSTDKQLTSKAELTKIQKGGFLRFLTRLLKSGLPLLKSAIKPLGMLGLTAAASATDAAINKKFLGSGNHTTLIISNDDMQDLLKNSKIIRR